MKTQGQINSYKLSLTSALDGVAEQRLAPATSLRKRDPVPIA